MKKTTCTNLSDSSTMKEKEKWVDLESENQRLRERLDAMEQELKIRKQRSRFRLLRFFAQTYATKPLYHSVSKLVDQLADRNVERDTVKDVLYAALRRLTRLGAITMLIALAPLSMAVLQTYYLKKQNEKIWTHVLVGIVGCFCYHQSGDRDSRIEYYFFQQAGEY